ncbi:hypothetical protein EON65_40425 [archaeon]|nr:MAG: hypothetical protein EON65_40425 [archaeon]
MRESKVKGVRKMQLQVLGWRGPTSNSMVFPLTEVKYPVLGVYHDFALVCHGSGTVDVFGSENDSYYPWLNHCRDQLKSTKGCDSIHFAESFMIIVCDDSIIWLVKPYLEKQLLNRGFVVDSVACGMKHCLILGNQQAFAYGHGEEGQLGLGTDVLHTDTLVAIPSTAVRCVAANAYHSAIVTEPYGDLYTFGSNAYARLGIPDTELTIMYSPVLVEALGGVGKLLPNGRSTGVRQVDCGLWHTVVIVDETYDIIGWGWNNFGQLGCTSNGNSEELVEYPRNILDDKLFVRVCCGNRFTALLTDNNGLHIM